MKILFVVDAFRGGAGNVIQILAREFTARGYKSVILLTNGKIAEPKYDLSGVEIIDHKLENYIRAKNPIDRIFKYKNELQKMFHQVKPDVIISFLTTNNILSCMANDIKVPLIVSERIDPAKTNTKIHWRVLRRLYYNRADVVSVQCSNFASFCNGKFKKKIVVTPNPIVIPEIAKNPEKRENIVFISIGRLDAQKNFPWMFDCMKKIHDQAKNTELRIFGDGPIKEQLQDKIAELNAGDYIKLCGYTNNPYEELSAADIYFMTSDFEGFPNALSEAMAMGLPSVSRICHEGIKDLVNDGVNGYLVNLYDKKGFVEKAMLLLKDDMLRASMVGEAKKVSEKYSVEKIISMWEEIIKKIENRNRS